MPIGTPTAQTPTSTNVSTYTVPSTIASGSVVALAIMDSPSPLATATYGATDTKGNTYVSGTSFLENTGSIVWVYGAITTGLVGGTDSWSFTKGGSAVGVYVVPCVCTGVTGTADGSAGGLQNGGTGNNTWNTGSGITTTNASDLLLIATMYCHGTTGLTETPAAGYTDFTPSGSYFSGWSQGITVAYQIASSTGTYAPTGTYSSSTNGNAAEILALQGSGGGGGGAPAPRVSQLMTIGVGRHGGFRRDRQGDLWLPERMVS